MPAQRKQQCPMHAGAVIDQKSIASSEEILNGTIIDQNELKAGRAARGLTRLAWTNVLSSA